MFENNNFFSSFSIHDTTEAKDFYAQTLGLRVESVMDGNLLKLHLKNGEVLMYAKPDHQPATFTVLNFEVRDLEDTMTKLKHKGIRFEKYPLLTDQNGIGHGPAGTDPKAMAWFKDPSGNVIQILEN